VTVNAAANSFNAGGAELATKTVRYQAKLAYRTASTAVVIGFSRVIMGNLGSDYNATATNEKYCAWSTAPAAGDSVFNIGGFDAVLSAGAGYTWSIPAATTDTVLDWPQEDTGWLTWVPAITCSGSLTLSSISVALARYTIDNNKLFYEIRFSGTLGGSASNVIYFTVPINCAQSANAPGMGYGFTAGIVAACNVTAGTPDKIGVLKYDVSNYATSGSCTVAVSGCYEI
jgi:hypothetical protein